MGKITVNLPDSLEEELRTYIIECYQTKIHGKLTEIVVTALEQWLKRIREEMNKRGETT